MRPRWIFVLLLSAATVGVVAGGVALWGHARESRADGLAVKYGAAPSKGEATVADRCTGVMLEEHRTTDDPRSATVGPKAFAVVAPKICALGVERGLVGDDGTMSQEAGSELMMEVVRQIGPARFQTLVFDELATNRYHLAKAGRATRWHRCVAMGYSAWDGQPSGTQRPPRDLYRRAVREACIVGIRRGVVPASGAPVTNSAAAAMQQLLMSTIARHTASQR